MGPGLLDPSSFPFDHHTRANEVCKRLHLLRCDCWEFSFQHPIKNNCQIYDTIRAAFLLSKVSGRGAALAAGIWIAKEEQKMTTTKISLFAGAAVVIAVGLVLAIRMNAPTSINDGHGTIGAQESYKAEVPISFSVGKTQMTPGSYSFRVENNSGNRVVTVQKADGSVSAMLMPFAGGSEPPKAWQTAGNPKISFNCLEGDSGRTCTLAKLWNGRDGFTYDFPAPKLSKAATERLAAVEFGLTRAD
jgi:hypothetical protein